MSDIRYCYRSSDGGPFRPESAGDTLRLQVEKGFYTISGDAVFKIDYSEDQFGKNYKLIFDGLENTEVYAPWQDTPITALAYIAPLVATIWAQLEELFKEAAQHILLVHARTYK